MSLSPILGASAVAAGGRAFDAASVRLLRSVSAESREDPGAALADMSLAKAQFRAGLATIRFSSEMWDALLQISTDRDDARR